MPVNPTSANPNTTYLGSTFQEVRDQIFSDPYQTLPTHQVFVRDMFKSGHDLLLQDSRRILENPADLLPTFQKLLHQNGICFCGTWNITEKSDYSGFFKQGSKGLLIVRVSTLLSRTLQGTRRGFGCAVKIFPTMDPHERVKTGNFVTINVLTGTYQGFTEILLSNNPTIGINDTLIKFIGPILVILKDFFTVDSQPTFRPLYPISELGIRTNESLNTPKFIGLKTASKKIKEGQHDDFRNELNVENFADGKLKITISVASEKKDLEHDEKSQIGFMEFTESVSSNSGDHRLHFHHSRNRK